MEEGKIIDMILKRIEKLENRTSEHFGKVFDKIEKIQLGMKDVSVELRNYKKITWAVFIMLMGIAGWIIKTNL